MKGSTIATGLAAILLIGCSNGTTDEETTGLEKEVFVAHFQVPCTGVAEQECLMVRESADAEWELRYDPIVGFEYEAGYDYRLTIREETVEDPPADASSIRWILIEALEKTPVDPVRSAGITVDGVWTLQSFGPAAELGEAAAQVEITLASLSDDRPVTMDLSETGRVAGHAGCNNYFSDFRVENGHQLIMGPAGATRMACEEELMALEQAFFQALDGATMVFVSGDEMELHGGTGAVLIFRRVEVGE